MGKARIHYFSATGNTRRAVDIAAARLSEEGWELELIPILARGPAKGGGGGAAPPSAPDSAAASAATASAATAPPDLTLVAFPTLAWGPPAFVRRHLLGLPSAEGERAAVLATCGGGALGALGAAARLLERRGYEVLLTGAATYPSNWTQFEDGPSEEAAARETERGDAEARDFAEKLASGARSRYGYPPLHALWSAPVALAFGFLGRRALGKLFVADASCTGCGLCARVCPAAAISMEGAGRLARPRWSFSCENCNRCINACPSRSIQSSLFRALLHGAAFVLLAAAALSWAGAAAGALAALGAGALARTAAYLAALAAGSAVALWLQFGLLDSLAYRLEGRAGSALRASGYTKGFRRYLAKGFDPAAEAKLAARSGDAAGRSPKQGS